MSDKAKPPVIGIEEHFWDKEVATHSDRSQVPKAATLERLYDFETLRLKEMDEAGIDMQVISHGAPALQKVAADVAPAVAKRANDRLHQSIKGHPDRFAAFAVLPVNDPKAAADELERCVTKLGFKGGMTHGLNKEGLFMDNKLFWPIYERAQALDVPIYLHPAEPHPAVVAAYYKDYVAEFPNILTSGWGFTVETATQGIRMVLSRVFETYPDLKMILGHMGESLPFSLWRINQSLGRTGGKIAFRDVFRDRFWITTSGNFSTPALWCSIMEMGVDRILFSVDWPMVDNTPGTDWMAGLDISAEDKAKILGGNAKRLLRL